MNSENCITYQVEVTEAFQKWHLDGVLHCEHGPAIICSNGDKYWYTNGQLNRLERSDGTKKWFRNGKYHREDGPAIINEYGTKEWYLNGKRHRENGPAIIWKNGKKAFYLKGAEIEGEQ